MPEPTMPAAPAASTTPTTPPPAAAPAPSAGGSFDNSFPDDGLDSPPDSAPPSPSGAASPRSEATPTSKDATDAAASASSTTSGTPEKPSSATDASKGDFTPPQVAKSIELRTWAQRMGTRAQKAETELTRMQARITQLETQPPKQAEDTQNLAKELASAKKRIDDYEGEMRLTKFERSNQYAEEYQKPYQEAVSRAYREIKELLITDEESGTERDATQADFDEVYALNLGQATKLAKAKFGDAFPVVLAHRQQIRQLAEKAYSAIEEYKTKGGERETQNKAQAAQQSAAMQRMFTSAAEGHAKRAPDIFSEREGDTEGNDLLAKGREFANTVFGGNEGLTPQNIAMRDAMAFNRLSAYPRVLRDNKKIKAELAEAQKVIASLRESGPGQPKSGGGKQEDGSFKPFDQAFDEIPD